MTTATTKKPAAAPAGEEMSELEKLRAQLAAATATISQLQEQVSKKSPISRVPTIPADKMAPEGTPLGTIQRKERGQQVEALAKLGRAMDPAAMCDLIFSQAEAAAKAAGKTVEEVVASLFEVKQRAKRGEAAPKVVDDNTASQPAA